MRDSIELSAELTGISSNVLVLHELFEHDHCLTNKVIQESLFAIHTQLERIAEELLEQ